MISACIKLTLFNNNFIALVCPVEVLTTTGGNIGLGIFPVTITLLIVLIIVLIDFTTEAADAILGNAVICVAKFDSVLAISEGAVVPATKEPVEVVKT